MPTAQPSANDLSALPGATLPEATDRATPTPELAPTAHATQRFTLYAWHGHLYASNVRGKLIDLGTLTQDGDRWAYDIDGERCPADSGLASAEEALAAAARSLGFLYLDGQFTAQRDLSDVHRPDLPDAPQLRIAFDPHGQGGPLIEPPGH
ncbi:hypothetical protein GCM10027019_21590 [Melaminivora jejuensis]|uniref:hypothetical protein n=1 Tax=Melaminivora jejuensis TaxID=1267217 RepID=UPI001E382FCC|nr:hypothetical protein [Melaminivora jejuensis]UHJ64841.1 hypothetical protein LVC68_16215 [Melaminivora jejuensis]